MEKQIYHLVNRLMEIFEVEQSALGQRWAEQFINSAKRSASSTNPIDVSLHEIESYRGNTRIKDLFNELKGHDGLLRGADGILHLASRLGTDDRIRKFIKIHNLLRESKAKKKLQQQQQISNTMAAQTSTPLQVQNQPPVTPASVQRPPVNRVAPPQINQRSEGFKAPMVQANMPSSVKTNRHPIVTTPGVHLSRHTQQFPLTQLNHQPAMMETPKHSSNSSRQHGHQSDNNHNTSSSTSIVAITPASHKNKRDRSRRSEKEQRSSRDVLYQKMKSFLNENQFLSFDFKKIDWSEMPPIPPLSCMKVQDQEAALINDLLYVLIGTEGKYIRMQPSRDTPNKHTIGVERGGDELVYTSATRIIKICPIYSTVVHYAEDVDFGLVNQALAAPIRDLVKEYLSLISNLQIRALRDDMTLQSMWLELQTIFYRMEALKQILDQISKNSCYGGHTLSVLHNRVVNYSTDPRTHEFCLRLMQAASEPYFEILERWLYLGVIEDPYGEFFIEDTGSRSDTNGPSFNSSFSNHCANIINQNQQDTDIDAFWRKRFSRDDSKVPEFLRSKQEKIFDTGKYLSVVRHYGKKVFRPSHYESLIYCPESKRYDEQVDRAYKFANKELLDLLLVENKLIDRLYSLKRYFLFSSGDFFVQFMDMADEELSKTKDEINMTRLESLLELALRTSSCNNDPYKDDVHIEMSDGSLYQTTARINSTNISIDRDPSNTDFCHTSGNLLGWESLTLSYDVSWPLSLVICKDYCHILYQMMFRHLFCCKYIERKLEATWRVNRLLHSCSYEGVFALRHKMLHFVNNLLFYIIEIIEPSFQILISKFKDGGIDSVSEVIELHRAFLSALVHDSMLTDNELLGHVTKLLLLCMDFSVVVEAKFASQEVSQLQASPGQGGNYVATQVRKISLSSQHQSANPNVFQARIDEIDRKFTKKMRDLINALTVRSQDFAASSKLQNIFYRLDFNNFYTGNLAS